MSRRACCLLFLSAFPALLGFTMGAGCQDVVTVPLEQLGVQVTPSHLIYCSNPEGPFPQRVGSVTITNNGTAAVLWEQGVRGETVRMWPIALDEDNGLLAPGQSVTVDVVALRSGSGSIDLLLESTAVIGVAEVTIVGEDDCATIALAHHLAQFFGEAEARVLTLILTGRVDPTQLSTTGGEQREPEAPQKPRGRTTCETQLDAGALEQRFRKTDFPCGQGDNGYTICPSISAAMPEGDYLLVFAVYGDDIPLTDTERLYQYAVVFDADGDATNNYVPDPAFENDFFCDSDRWYEATYSPSEGWKLTVTDARNNNFTEIASAARIIISENAFVLVVPASEFEVSEPSYRVTAFCHEGDFGLNPGSFWSGDLDPPVSDGLAPFEP